MSQKIYILTITKNDISGLKKTINSIELLSTRLEIVHIIKNFEEDETSKFIRQIKPGNVKRILIDTKDHGIYDAMNKAIEFVPIGEMFIFINSGDIICGNLDTSINENAILLDAYLNLKESKSNRKIKIKNNYNSGMPFNHQSLICRKEIDMKFDEGFKISADYLFVLKWISPRYKSPRSIPQLDSAYIIYDGSGISSNKKLLRDIEALKAILLVKGFFSSIIYCISRLRSFPRYISYKLKINLK